MSYKRSRITLVKVRDVEWIFRIAIWLKAPTRFRYQVSSLIKKRLNGVAMPE